MTETERDQDQPQPGKPKVRYVTQLEIQAAKLRITVDRRLGRKTPDWVFRLANAKPEDKSA